MIAPKTGTEDDLALVHVTGGGDDPAIEATGDALDPGHMTGEGVVHDLVIGDQ